ncbi:MAG TPA: tetratricopeptide repeat protein [Syntrophorhabdaceae bacterium]|nr:tetratricopeptide repeat protein [Syntrophorhabdaceae bacterium]
MSVIQDALKRAEEDRKKKGREASYPALHNAGKSRIPLYIVALLVCVAAVVMYLYTSHSRRLKPVDRPVAASAAAKPIKAEAPSSTAPQMLQPVQKAKGKAGEHATTIVASIKPVGEPPVLMKPHKRSLPGAAEAEILKTRSTAISPSPAKKEKTMEQDEKQVTTSDPVRAVERKADEGAVDVLYNEALNAQESGRLRQAKDLYKQILVKQPDHTEALNNLGVIAIQEDNRAEALFYFKKILESHSDYPKAYNNIGLIVMRDQEGKLAEEYFRKAIALEPDSVEPYLNLSALLRSQGRLQDASKLLEIPLSKKIKEPNLFLSYAVIKDRLGQYEEAARYYRQYLSSVKSPGARKDVLERLRYIEKTGQ